MSELRFALAALATLGAGCAPTVREDSRHVELQEQGGGGTADTTGAGDSATASASTAGTGGSACETATTGAGGSDYPGWTQVPWACCTLLVATDPTTAVPPLAWKACDSGVAGCEMVDSPFLVRSASVVRVGDGYRFALLMQREDPDPGQYAVIYEDDGSPMVAWWVPYGANACWLTAPLLSDTRVIVGGGKETNVGFETRYMDALQSEAAFAVSSTDLPGGAYYPEASDKVFSVGRVGDGTMSLFDRVARQPYVVGDSGSHSVQAAHVVRDAALLMVTPQLKTLETWVWTREHPVPELLIQPPNQSVLCIRSDGDTLAWLQAPAQDYAFDAYPSSDLWTAPWVSSREQLAPTKRRAAPPVSWDGAVAGRGYYATESYDPTFEENEAFHVYRLADAHHWSFDASYAEGALVYIDERYLVYPGFLTLYRQDLSALGEGD